MGSEFRPLLSSESQLEHFSLDTNRIYQSGVSELQEPNWGLRNRITGWSERVRQITRPSGYEPINSSDIELPNTTSGDVEIPIEQETSFSVEIPESVSETTGLLSGVESVGFGSATGAAATGTGLSTASIVGIGAGTAIGAGIAGYLAHKATSGITLPGHHYIGPGNPLNGHQPVDKDDEIAKEHDEAYNIAKTSEDVINADKKAIDRFAEDYKKNGNLHSLLGQAGLQIKTAVEQRFGVIYPSVSGT